MFFLEIFLGNIFENTSSLLQKLPVLLKENKFWMPTGPSSSYSPSLSSFILTYFLILGLSLTLLSLFPSEQSDQIQALSFCEQVKCDKVSSKEDLFWSSYTKKIKKAIFMAKLIKIMPTLPNIMANIMASIWCPKQMHQLTAMKKTQLHTTNLK